MSAGALLGLSLRPCLSHAKITKQWSLALGGLWEASWEGGPGIGDSSVEKMCLAVRASSVARAGSVSELGGLEVCKHRLDRSFMAGLWKYTSPRMAQWC